MKRKGETTEVEVKRMKQQSITSAFNLPSKKESLDWQMHKTVLWVHYTPNTDSSCVNNAEPCKISAFDLDHTLIKPKSGKVFSTDSNDWTFFDQCISSKLKDLVADGHVIIIFSNQSGLAKPGKKMSIFKEKISAIFGKLNIPLWLFAATEDDEFRKPRTGMWEYFSTKLNNEIDLQKSYFVGDAAGRLATNKLKADFSSSDRKFALNIPLTFYTADEFFKEMKYKEPFDIGFDINAFTTRTETKTVVDLTTDVQEMVILTGYPASGKSTFVKRNFPLYVQVSMDIHKSKPKTLKLAHEAIEQGKSVIVDNTNPSKESRKQYIDMAKAAGIPVRSVHLDVPLELAIHMNIFRSMIGVKERIPKIAYNTYKSKFQKPDSEEGFEELLTIAFEMNEFETEKHHERLFKMHLT